MTSSRLVAPLYIQCLPSSLAATRSIVLFTPNGLPQRMQQNGSSSLRTRGDAVAARKSSCGFSVMTFSGTGGLAQAALHAGVLGEAQHRPLGIVGQGAGRASRDAGKAQRAARDVDLHRAERRARGQSHHIDRRRCGAVQLAQREPQHIALATDRLEARRPGAGTIGDRAQRGAEGVGIVGLDSRRRAHRRSRALRRIGSASARVRRRPVTSWRGRSRNRKRTAEAP